ncbi:MAG: CBS domain-containing protein [Actinobacteria bacterium]|nr:CBS domain-containing protein [Actinomycetota bacterium]MBU1944765.1 CBS domain-containing protein [Actinomycetota bacterium]MBU2688856.1 CBS domain-containing protein [Actinomycetota bacterium]
MKVRELMSTQVVTVQKSDPIRTAWELVQLRGLRRFPVMDGDRLVGIITDRDLRNATASSVVLTEKKYHDFLLDTVKVETVMSADPTCASPDDDVREAARRILELKVGGLPVVEGGKLVGIITETDLINALVEVLSTDAGG